MAFAEVQLGPESWSPIDDGGVTPQIEVVDVGTVSLNVWAFADTNTEILNANAFKVPRDLDTSGTVTFRIYRFAKTVAASKNVEYTFDHRAVADGEALDGSYTSEVSGDIAVTNTQDRVDIDTWTETVSNLGWAANDLIEARLRRTAPTANNLSGDDYFHLLVIEIPIA